jgi:predicted nucleic acid-binding protein
MRAGLVDTSVWIAGELGRKVDRTRLPDRAFVSVITLAELQAGVLAAADTATRSRRMATVNELASVTPLPVDSSAARHWAGLRVQLHEAGRRANVNDLWIAAIALANDLPVVTQDRDFDVFADLGMLEVVRV